MGRVLGLASAHSLPVPIQALIDGHGLAIVAIPFRLRSNYRYVILLFRFVSFIAVGKEITKTRICCCTKVLRGRNTDTDSKLMLPQSCRNLRLRRRLRFWQDGNINIAIDVYVQRMAATWPLAYSYHHHVQSDMSRRTYSVQYKKIRRTQYPPLLAEGWRYPPIYRCVHMPAPSGAPGRRCRRGSHRKLVQAACTTHYYTSL
jgi:hypothetical protein